FHTFSSLHVQHASGATELLRQTPLRPYAGSAPLELHHHHLLLLLLHSHHLYKHIKQELDDGQELDRGQDLGSEPSFHHYHFCPRCAGHSKASTSTPPHLHATEVS